MPYFTIGPDSAEEFGLSADQSGECYEPAEATIDFDSAGPFVKTVRNALLEKRFHAVNCKYDGGYDEGFAYFEHAISESAMVSVAEVAEMLKDSPTVDAYARMHDDDDTYSDVVKLQLREHIEAVPMDQRILDALDEFAHELASELLGESYGTGDCSIRGRFGANLRTGQIADLEDQQ